MCLIVIYKPKDDIEFFKNELVEQNISFIDLDDDKVSQWLMSIGHTPLRDGDLHRRICSLDACVKKHKKIFISSEMWISIGDIANRFKFYDVKVFLFESKVHFFSEQEAGSIVDAFDASIVTRLIHQMGKPFSPLVNELVR